MSSNLFSSYDMVGVFRELGVIRYIDYAFAAFVQREDKSDNKQLIAVLAALVSYTTTRLNNVCLDLSQPLNIFSSTMLESDDDVSRLADVCLDIENLLTEVDLAELFNSSNIIAVDPDAGSVPFPLVYSAGKLYLERYWLAECKVAAAMRQRVSIGANDVLESAGVMTLSSVYSRFDDPVKSWGQQLAVFGTLRSDFSVITGGPGTGKTTVVAVILALYFEKNPDARVALVAPTGKAQARLKDAVFEEFEYLTVAEDVKNRMQNIEFKTLHSLLGLRRGRVTPTAEMHYDFIVVDEASMVSVLLFEKFFDAVNDSTKIVLLGDRDQLAAVDGGAVLSDVCASAGKLAGFSSEFVADFSRTMPEYLVCPEIVSEPSFLQDVVIPLEYTFRFSSESGIGKFKNLLVEESVSELELFLAVANDRYSDSFKFHQFRSFVPTMIHNDLLDFVDSWSLASSGTSMKKFLAYIKMDSVSDAYSLFSEFQIITALNKGMLGVDSINSLIISKLGINPEGARGLPIMIEKNDYQNGLFNGDIGMYWEDSSGKMKVWFPDSANENMSEIAGYKSFLPSQIPQNSPAFAMTIHKSQGSGFGAVLLILQSVLSELLTKELLYTAVTRAKSKIDVFGDAGNVITIANKKVCRIGGLVGRLE